MENVMAVFTLVTTIATVLFIFIWSVFLIAYLKYRRDRHQLHQKSAFKMPWGIPMSWLCLVFFVFIIVLLTFEDDTRKALSITPFWFIGVYIAWLFTARHNKSLPPK